MEETVNRTEFNVLFAKADSIYVWKHFKTFGGARRYIKRKFRKWFSEAYGMESWAIERYVHVGIRLTDRSCVLAQTKNFPVWQNLHRENLLKSQEDKK